MSVEFRPLKNRVLVLLDGAVEQHHGSIIVPSTVRASLYQGVVVSTGPKVKDAKVGEAVIISKFDKTPLDFGDGQEYRLVPEECVLCALDSEL